MNPEFRYPVAAGVVLGIVAVLTTLAYVPALSGYLAFDDYPHIAPLYSVLQSASPLGLWEAIWSSNSGLTGRPVAMATLVGQIVLPGGDPEQLKWLNLFIHLLVGFAIFRLARLLIDAKNRTLGSSQPLPATALAFALATIWTLHPFNLGAVAYAIQRMTSLSALFVMLGLIVYVRMRLEAGQDVAPWKRLPTIGVLWLLGIFSKENAVLLPVFIVLIEWLVLRHVVPPLPFIPRTAVWRTLLLVALTLVATLVAVFATIHFADRYGGRPFDLAERLLTQGRVLVWYVQMLVAPDVGQMSLFHDGWVISRSWTEPANTLLSWAALGGLLGFAFLVRHRMPLVAVGVLWFFAGHLLESTIVPLELVFEHRNYLPGMGIFLAALALIAHGLQWLNRPAVAQVGLLTFTVVLAVPLALATHARAERWADNPQVRLAHLEAREASLRARIEAAQIHADLATRAQSREAGRAHRSSAEALFASAANEFPASPDPLFGWILFRQKHSEGEVIPLFDEVERRISLHERVGKTAGNGIHALRRCVIDGPCSTLSDRTLSLIETALAQPSNGKGAESRLRRDQAFLLFSVGRPDAALSTMANATRLVPQDVETRIDYAVLLARAGERSEALEQVAVAQSLDQWGHKVQTLRRLRAAIVGGQFRGAPVEGQTKEEEMTRGG